MSAAWKTARRSFHFKMAGLSDTLSKLEDEEQEAGAKQEEAEKLSAQDEFVAAILSGVPPSAFPQVVSGDLSAGDFPESPDSGGAAGGRGGGGGPPGRRGRPPPPRSRWCTARSSCARSAARRRRARSTWTPPCAARCWTARACCGAAPLPCPSWPTPWARATAS